MFIHMSSKSNTSAMHVNMSMYKSHAFSLSHTREHSSTSKFVFRLKRGGGVTETGEGETDKRERERKTGREKGGRERREIERQRGREG